MPVIFFSPQILSFPILKLPWQSALLFFPQHQDCSFQVNCNPFLFPTYSFSILVFSQLPLYTSTCSTTPIVVISSLDYSNLFPLSLSIPFFSLSREQLLKYLTLHPYEHIAPLSFFVLSPSVPITGHESSQGCP